MWKDEEVGMVKEMKANTRYLRETDYIAYMVQNRIRTLPIIDHDDKIVDVVFNA